MQQKRLPIGYYLKLADNRLTKGIDEIQSQHGLNRIEWQILNSIYEKPSILKQEIIEIMKPLADSQFVETVLSKFNSKNIIETNNNILILTTVGQELHKLVSTHNKNLEKKQLWVFQKRITKRQFLRYKK